MKAKEYVCLNCQKLQPRPENPLRWCERCGGLKVIKLEDKCNEAYLHVIRIGMEYCMEYCIENAKEVLKSTQKRDVIHVINTDTLSIDICSLLLNRAMSRFHTGGDIPLYSYILSQERIDYICSISSYHNGRFNFNKEVK